MQSAYFSVKALVGAKQLVFEKTARAYVEIGQAVCSEKGVKPRFDNSDKALYGRGMNTLIFKTAELVSADADSAGAVLSEVVQKVVRAYHLIVVYRLYKGNVSYEQRRV